MPNIQVSLLVVSYVAAMMSFLLAHFLFLDLSFRPVSSTALPLNFGCRVGHQKRHALHRVYL